MPQKSSTKKCNCYEGEPATSGTATFDDSSIPMRPILEKQGFKVIPPGIVVDKHDCNYVRSINALIPMAVEHAQDEAEEIARAEGKTYIAHRGPPAELFHKWMDILAEKRKLRKPVNPEYKAGWKFRRNGKAH